MFLLRRAALRLPYQRLRCLSSKSGPNAVVGPIRRTPLPLEVIKGDRAGLNIGKASFTSAQVCFESSATAEDPEDASFGATKTTSRAAPYSFRTSPDRTGSGDLTSEPPVKAVYLGNLFFSVSEQDLEKEMSRFGKVTHVKIIYDGRGLSKGFGFVEFAEVESAERAVTEMNGQYYEGRPVSIQYARKRASSQGVSANPPSKTIFIGNMPFEMSDRDLNDLFREIRNVVDVRVAVDRRTGQPRGFAHADFVDVESAVKARESLHGKQLFDRKLRVDFSAHPQVAARPASSVKAETAADDAETAKSEEL